MIRRVVAFDLDNTLADSKSPISPEIAGLLDRLLAKFQVCVISGGKFEQFETQLVDKLNVPPDRLISLHLMPTCGTRCYRFDLATAGWREVYAEDLATGQRATIVARSTRGRTHLVFVSGHSGASRSRIAAAR